MAKILSRRELQEERYTVIVHRDAETGLVVREYWQMDGKDHREGAPALIVRDAVTEVVVQEVWCQKGKLHRDDGPAEILRKADTGRIYYSAWHQNGVKTKPPPSAKRPSSGPRAASLKPK